MPPAHSPTPLLIIGAGPFGLALAAWVQHRGVRHTVVGTPMGFWKQNMPRGMFLRSDCDWHLDPVGVHTIRRYLDCCRLHPGDVDPIPLDLYLEYCEWLRTEKGIEPMAGEVVRLDGDGRYFTATLADGTTLTAGNVALALGVQYFRHLPDPYPTLFPPDRVGHTCDVVDLVPCRGGRVLIIGGRQSAFEWAALLADEGAARIHLSYRHPTPDFAPSEWGWVPPLVDAMVDNPAWYRLLPQDEKDAVGHRLWVEGRLKLEPWLARRISSERIELHPESTPTRARELPDGSLLVTLSTGATLTVDRVILATGYKVALDRVPLLTAGNLMGRIQQRNGYPVLDLHLQSSVPGLFITSMCAAQDFGPFFGFTVSTRTSARLIGAGLCVT